LSKRAGESQECTAFAEPNQAVVHGQFVFNVTDMSEEQVQQLYTLAEAETVVDAFPEVLKAFLVTNDPHA